MKLHVISDLHLSVYPFAPPRTDADVVVLAGDIAREPEAIAWAQGFKKPVVLVPGNHEFYGSSMQETVQELRQLAQGTAVHVLDNDRLVLDGIRFLGSTLWTDFSLAAFRPLIPPHTDRRSVGGCPLKVKSISAIFLCPMLSADRAMLKAGISVVTTNVTDLMCKLGKN